MDRFQASLSEDGRSRLLLDAITDYAIYMLDIDGVVTSWNAGAQRFKGYSEAEILGHHFSRFYTDQDRAAGLPDYALRTARTEGRFENEGWRVRKDGTHFWAHVVIDAVRDPVGNVIGYAKVTRDLTERRKAEQALIQSEEQFRRLVQGVTDYAIYMLQPDGRVANWNVGAERIKGYSADEIVGQSFARFYTPEDRAAGEPAKALATARREGRYEREAWRVRKDGTRFLASVVIDAIRDTDGELLGFAKITRDITERAEAQKKLELAREQLFQSQKMEAIGQLTGGVAHDFNNLLTVILGSLELLRKRLPDNSSMERLLDNAVEAAQRGSTLTGRMLAFARRQDLTLQPTELQGLVHNMTDLMQRSLGPQIRIETRFPPALPAVLTDPAQLETALLNLAVNARDAMPAGGTLTISATEQVAEPGSDDSHYVRLSVRDEGEGMNPETLARAAEPFFTTKGVGKGTGLGLSMVHGLAEQSGGRLTLESEPGLGTTATIYLPVAEAGATDVQIVTGYTGENATASQAKSLVVLAVDDDPLVLMNTAAMLEDLGHTAIDVLSGSEALQRLETQHIDMVITDHAMPRMSGSELAAAIQMRWPDIPIVLATGYAELPSGGNQTLPRLSKPFSQADLARAIAGVPHISRVTS
ncbi:MAG: sensor histidine kinase/response regulator hybrid protein [Devosia sp.]|uniref:hybrid sensor histidine kinase/response regulator n=1 Tax=Devosia sp. TaxID=1871048 RepID=UPI00263056F1|nr:PAS domain-containing sensor histidine kinase [Devosia sp.]MDB5539202.1 sensor histidine kinase/response regulator hybrid protein [Devosia sp.]